MVSEQPAYLTPQQTADLTSIPLSTLRWWRANGGVDGPPSFKLGGRVRYARAEVEAWIEAQRTASRER